MDHEFYMKEALAEAANAIEVGELPIAAVIVCGNEIIARSSTKERELKRWLVHAELLALEQADKLKPYPGKRRETRIYTTLEPCMMCLGACMTFNVGEVYFALESPGDGAVDLLKKWKRKNEDMPSYQAPKVVGGLMRQNSMDLFKRYSEKYTSGGLADWAKTLAAL